MTARGIRNKNPGNLRHSSAFVWEGEQKPDLEGYCTFDTAFFGIRALALDLLTKYRRGANTLRLLLPIYAPPSENDTEKYIEDLVDWLGMAPEENLRLVGSPDSEIRHYCLTKAMIRKEDGSVPYSDEAVMTAVRAAREHIG